MRATRTGRYGAAAIALAWTLAGVPPAHAGPPPLSCTEIPGCPLASDAVRFGEGDPDGYGILGTIRVCHVCGVNSDGSLDLQADMSFEFGPYDPSLCLETTDTVTERINGLFQVVDDGGGSNHVVPWDPLQPFDVPLVRDFLTRCVSDLWLDWRIRDLRLTGARGAEAISLNPSFQPAELNLPDNTRSALGDEIQFPAFRFRQDLTFAFPEPIHVAWYGPEALPVHVLPGSESYAHDIITFGPDATYDPAPPFPSNLAPTSVVTCQGPAGGPSCTGSQGTLASLDNFGYLDTWQWYPVGTPTVDRTGLAVALVLPAGAQVVYQPIFPQGTRLALGGPASVTIAESRIVSGQFDGGAGWVQMWRFRPCDPPSIDRQFALETPVGGPEIRDGGSLVAPVQDFNAPGSLDWTFNQADGLGCGTLYVPSGNSDWGPGPPYLPVRPPQDTWYQAEGVTVAGRGLHAGFNYNRNAACVQGSTVAGACSTDTDCSPGFTCTPLWSPKCEATLPSPTWTTTPGNVSIAKPIPPGDPASEMAFYVRRSGVTGVFDAGDDPFEAGQPSSGTFLTEYTNFGYAFLGSNTAPADSILSGTLKADWPAYTGIPFQDMRVCDCGQLDSGAVPDGVLDTLYLEYWDLPYLPFGFTFLPSGATSCSTIAPASCGASAATGKACVLSLVTLRHLSPEIDGTFDLAPAGQVTQFDAAGIPALKFEPSAAEPFRFDYKNAEVLHWGPETGNTPSRCAVTGQPSFGQPSCGGPICTTPFGWVDSAGELSVPYFGLTASDLMVRRPVEICPPPQPPPSPVFEVNLHGPGGEATFGTPVTVQRDFVKGKLPFAFQMDYYRPSETAVDDGADEGGRGLLLGYATDIPVGALHTASAFVATPSTFHGDVGPAGATRLWGLTTPAGRAKLNAILPADRLNAAATSRYGAALQKLGTVGIGADQLASSADLSDAVHQSGAMASLEGHPDWQRPFAAPGSPGLAAKGIAGALVCAAPPNPCIDRVKVDARMDAGPFFRFDRGQLSVERFVDPQGVPIIGMKRPTLGGNMDLLNGKFPLALGGDALKWSFDYDYSGGAFAFQSVTGSADLGGGALSGLFFKELGATLQYYADGDWYFQAKAQIDFSGKGAEGALLFGNTKDNKPLKALDKDVGSFLGKFTGFNGGYARVGVKSPIVDYGCLLRVSAGVKAGGWYAENTWGGKVSGSLWGKGACLVGVKGKLTLTGGVVQSTYKLHGSFWVAGGIGDCDEDDWDSPGDVMDDSWCYACVLKSSADGQCPQGDCGSFQLKVSKPSKQCG